MVITSSPTILLGLPEDIYAAVDSYETAQEIWLRVQQIMKGSDIGIQEKKAKLFNEWERFTSTKGESIESYYHHFLKLMNDFKRNKHFPEKNANYTQLYDFLKYNQNEVDDLRAERLAKTHDPLALMNGNVVAARAEGNAIGNNGNQIRCYNCRGLGHLARNCTVRPRRRDAAYLHTQLLIAQKEEAGIQLQAEEFDLMAAAADLDEIKEVNANCILMANLQQASTSDTQTDKAPVYDSNGLAELLEPIPEPHQVQQNDSNVISEVSSMEQSGGTLDQHPATVEETRAYLESLYNNLAIEVEKVNSVNRKMKETNANLTTVNRKLRETNADLTTELARYKNQEKEADESRAKHKALELEIERLLQAVVSHDIMSIVLNPLVVETSDLHTELDPERPKRVPPTFFASNDLSNPVTSNSVPTTNESKVMENNKVIAPRMFMIDPRKTSREDKFVPINKFKVSVRTNPITVSQPHVITKKDVNSDSNGLYSTGLDSTAKTRRPQPRSNTKNDRVLSASQSSCIKNKEVEVEEHHRNLLLFKNKKHMSYECNNIKLAIRNDKSEVVCAMCKQCVITDNHDVCVPNYVNGMNVANVSKSANQKKHKP
ncbi:retrovirus-related pol polyprotein from transposon TNT 1-94 [Tanacetum coccineum]